MSGFRGPDFGGPGTSAAVSRTLSCVDVVAVVTLTTSVEAEAPALAADLGVTPYEAGLMLRVPSPAQVLRTDDRGRALALLARLRARGHEAVACDLAAVATGERLHHVRTFRLEDDALVVDAGASPRGPTATARTPWTDVVAIVRAIHRTRTERLEKTEERKLSMGRAALSGGLVMRKGVTKETRVETEEREQVLYVFPSSGAPLLFAQTRVRYEGLGPLLRPIQIENFMTLIRVLRERQPLAAYDERLIAARPTQERVRTLVRGHQTASSAEGIDLLAHLVALAIARRPPYR